MRREWLAQRGVVLVVAMLCLNACELPRDETGGAGQELLPSTSTSDWVTYGDVALRARALEVVEVPASAEELQAGEGIIGRQVKFGVEDIVWEQPSRNVEAPQTVVIDAGGWAFHGNSRQRLEVSEIPEFVVGHDYLLVLANTRMSSEGSPVWIPIGNGAMLPFDDGIVGRGEGVDADGAGAKAAWGMTASQVHELLATSPPDPGARSVMTLDALARLTAVQTSSP